MAKVTGPRCIVYCGGRMPCASNRFLASSQPAGRMHDRTSRFSTRSSNRASSSRKGRRSQFPDRPRTFQGPPARGRHSTRFRQPIAQSDARVHHSSFRLGFPIWFPARRLRGQILVIFSPPLYFSRFSRHTSNVSPPANSPKSSRNSAAIPSALPRFSACAAKLVDALGRRHTAELYFNRPTR